MVDNLEGKNFHVFIGGEKYSFKKEFVADVVLIADYSLMITETTGDVWVFNLDRVDIVKVW